MPCLLSVFTTLEHMLVEEHSNTRAVVASFVAHACVTQHVEESRCLEGFVWLAMFILAKDIRLVSESLCAWPRCFCWFHNIPRPLCLIQQQTRVNI